MLFTIGDSVVATQKWETETELLKHLEKCNGGFLLLNKNPEYKADFFPQIFI